MTESRTCAIRFASLALSALLAVGCLNNSFASEKQGLTEPVVGQQLSEVIDSIRQLGYPIVYTSQLVTSSMLVQSEPTGREPIELVNEILRPYGLKLNLADGIYFVVRNQSAKQDEIPGSILLIIQDQGSESFTSPVNIRGSPLLPEAEILGQGVFQYNGLAAGQYTLDIEAPGYQSQTKSIEVNSMDVAVLSIQLEIEVTVLEELKVSTSRYTLAANSRFFIDQRAIENLPDIGDDPIRSAHRLPGVAAGGWSAQSYFRGGEKNETAIYLNGLKLLDPFHVRDYQNVFSSIDARSISGVEAYTGGFPVGYGDRMSGVLVLESQQSAKPRQTELGLSVFNTSILTSGHTANNKVNWLLSARNSNLKYVLDKDVGEPSYNDIFVSAGINFSDRFRMTVNALRAEDAILVVTESAIEEREQATSDTLNRSFWLSLENDWTLDLSSTTVLATSKFKNDRDAIVLDPEQLVGQVMDDRDIKFTELKQDWTWTASERHLWQFGFEIRDQKASYRYISAAEYFGFYLALPGVPESIERDVTANYAGQSYSVYLSDRFAMNANSMIEFGLRWDKQTYLGPIDDDQISPRISVFYNATPKTDLRLSWGSYYQSQGIHELQVEDGVETFFPAQRADHLIAGVHYKLGRSLRLRTEVYQKDYKDLRPRFENLQDSLALVPELEPDRVPIAPDSGRSRGIELTLENTENDELDWWLSYTWSRVTDSIDGRDQKRNWDQQHALQTGIAWHMAPWEIGLAANIHTGWPTTTLYLVEGADEDDEYTLVYGSRNTENFKTFASLDFRVSREWNLKNSRISAFFEISNALNRKNECCIDYDIEDEDADEIILEESIDYWLPVLPAIGILWEF